MIIPERQDGVKVKGRSRASRRLPTRHAVGRAEPGPEARQQRRRGVESRLRILEATFELANELGYRGTSISKVVERSGLPASSVYWHFADKDALFAAMIQHSFEQWAASMPRWTPPTGGRPRRDEVAARIRSAVESIAASPEFWRLGLVLSLERQPAEFQARQLFMDIRRRVIGNMAAFWRLALPAGHERRSPDLPELLARFTMAAADGLFVSAHIDSDYDYRRLTDLLADMLETAAARLA